MTEIIIAAPYCTPQRKQILTMLNQFGVTSARIADAYVLGPDGDRGREDARYVKSGLPVRQVYHVRVSPAAAVWAEYVLLRSQKYELLSKAQEPRNEQWAARWDGKMPQPWLVGTCASNPAPPAKPVALKDDSVGYRLLRTLRRN